MEPNGTESGRQGGTGQQAPCPDRREGRAAGDLFAGSQPARQRLSFCPATSLPRWLCSRIVSLYAHRAYDSKAFCARPKKKVPGRFLPNVAPRTAAVWTPSAWLPDARLHGCTNFAGCECVMNVMALCSRLSLACRLYHHVQIPQTIILLAALNTSCHLNEQ